MRPRTRCCRLSLTVLGMGLGFTVGSDCNGIVRELIGAGQTSAKQILPIADEAAGKAGYVPVTIFILAPGAFLVLAGWWLFRTRSKPMLPREVKKL